MKYTKTLWIDICNKVHNNKYNYDFFPESPKSSEKVIIVCPDHGKFTQILDNHRSGKGCPECANKSRGENNQKGKKYYIDKANLVHNNQYDYSGWPNNVKSNTKVKIICKKHGPFIQKVDSHVGGKGCPECGRIQARKTIVKKYGVASPMQNTISSESLDLLHNKTWLQEQYIDNKQTMSNIAAHLSVDSQTVSNYLQYHNINVAPIRNVSSAENDILKFCTNFTQDIVSNSRTLIPPKEIDIYLPKHNIAIEYCGLYWHSEQQGKDKWYHYNKWKQCHDKGIQLLTIYEDEWRDRTNQVKNKIKSLLGVDDRVRIYARKCDIVEISREEKKTFFENNHIQGDGPSSVNIGLKYGGELVACVGLIKQAGNTYYLNRYATCANVVGGFSKLIKYFQRNFIWKRIISFADLRWSDGRLYTTTHWALDKIIDPEYYYSPPGSGIRYHKFNYRRKRLPSLLKEYNPNLSERVNCNNNGILRIWDCGKLKYILNNKDYE